MKRVNLPDFDGVPLDTRTILHDRLNIETKERSNLFPWNGQFSPQLIEAFLQTYAARGSFVLDPFLGSGTVLHEAGRLGHSAFGVEVNPAAFKMAAVYRFLNVSAPSRQDAIADADERINSAVPETLSLFRSHQHSPGLTAKRSLTEQARLADEPLCRSLLEALVVLLNYGDKELTTAGVLTTWRKLRYRVIALPQTSALIELANCDARRLPLPDGKVDLVVTSPPYVNVFNYHQQYRRSVEALGWNMLEVAKSEIGSNRKHRGNRFLTIIQYCIDMAAVLGEVRRVCKPRCRVIVVVGRESNVRKTKFFNGELMARLAVRAVGYRLESRQERVFQNRFGEMIFEDILHLVATNAKPTSSPTQIARESLEAARHRAPEESIPDLESALEKVGEVMASPLYCSSAAVAEAPSRMRKEVVNGAAYTPP